MKIVHLSQSDIEGGAARAAYKLHKALCEAGIDSHMLVQSKASGTYSITTPYNTHLKKIIAKIRPLIDRALLALFYRKRSKTLFSPSILGFSKIVDEINKINPDIIHLHWVCGGMMNMNDLSLLKNYPIIWSLCDMWPITGGCHYDDWCGNYVNNCGNCKVLGSNHKYDLSHYVFNKKQITYKQLSSITFAAKSLWIKQCAENSPLCAGHNVIHLPNLIDTNLFSPIEMNIAKKILGLDIEKKYILFGADGATSDPRKGFQQLTESLQSFLDEKNIEFLVFGSEKPEKTIFSDNKIHYLGHIHDDITLKIIYCSASVMVVPSLQENLANTIMESLSCGTPVVAFDIGGNRDMIVHLKNGYLAEPFNVSDLTKGIQYILYSAETIKLSRNARETICTNFASHIMVNKYQNVYSKLLQA